MLQKKVVKGVSGWLMVVVLLDGIAACITVIAESSDTGGGARIVTFSGLLALDGVAWLGPTVVNSNMAKVVLLFGHYLGSLKSPGFWWVNPLTSRRLVSLRARNFESGKLKLN